MGKRKFRIGTKVMIKGYRGRSPQGRIIGFVKGKYKVQSKYGGYVRYVPCYKLRRGW